jgi:hypothetical protein
VTVCILPLVEISLPQQHRFDKHRKKVAGDFLTGPMHSEAPKVEPSKKLSRSSGSMKSLKTLADARATSLRTASIASGPLRHFVYYDCIDIVPPELLVEALVD